MYEQNCTLAELPHLDTPNIYQILSNFTTALSQLIATAYKILIFSYQDEHYEKNQWISKLEDKLSLHFPSQEQIEKEQLSIKISQMIKKRLINRVIEIIMPYKNMASKYEYMKPLLALISQIQNDISIFYQQESLFSLIMSIKTNFSTFISIVKLLSNLQNPNLNYSELFLYQSSKKSIQLKRPLEGTKHESETAKRYKKINSMVNKRFRVYSCMELDYSHFRSSYFEAKNDEDLLDEFVRRNSRIQSMTTQYSKDFENYRNRKKYKGFQKGFSLRHLQKRLVTDPDTHKTDKSFHQIRIISRRIGTKIEKKPKNQFGINEISNQQEERQKRHSMKDRKSETDGVKINLSPLKTEMKMKSILMTAERYQIQPIRKATYKTSNPIKYSIEYRRKLTKKQQKIFMHEVRSQTKRLGEQGY